jgi:hypothetical protein
MLSVGDAKRFLAIGILATMVSACALSRSEIAVPSQSSTQPESGVAVVVLPPVDGRRFEAAPNVPSIPSLKEQGQITDVRITSRAVGRKRNGYGSALGDVLLLPPQTTSSIVADAVKAGLQDSGFRIVDAADPAYASARKISVRINEFWTWITPGFGSIKLDNSTDLTLEGDISALSTPARIQVHETKGYFAISESDWSPFIDSALRDVREKVRSIVSQKLAAVNTEY